MFHFLLLFIIICLLVKDPALLDPALAPDLRPRIELPQSRKLTDCILTVITFAITQSARQLQRLITVLRIAARLRRN